AAGCSGGPGASIAIETASQAPSQPASTLPTPPADAAPAELQGAWSTQMAADDEVTLTITETGYSIKRGSFTGFGHIAVNGDEITFSGNEQCDGAGTYRWEIADGQLTFTPAGEPDPCPRLSVLQGQTYVKVAT